MNERIKKLTDKVWSLDIESNPQFNQSLEQFARLIVGEMLILTYQEEARYYDMDSDYLAKAMENYRELAKQHFGIKS